MKISAPGHLLEEEVSSSDHRSLGRPRSSLIGITKFSVIRVIAGQCAALFFSCGEVESAHFCTFLRLWPCYNLRGVQADDFFTCSVSNSLLEMEGAIRGQLGVWIPTDILPCGFRWASGADPPGLKDHQEAPRPWMSSPGNFTWQSELLEGGPRPSAGESGGGRKTQREGRMPGS